jgi:hypothetical protein
MNYETGSDYNGPGRRTLRIVGHAFEVVNETPEIYQQGAVTVYRYPLDDSLKLRSVMPAPQVGELPSLADFVPPISGVTSNSSIQINKLITELRAPPTNQATAVLVPGSQTWKAREGCYVVGTQYVNEIPFKTIANGNLAFVGSTPTLGPSFTGSLADYSFVDNSVRMWNGGNEVTNPLDMAFNAVFPFNMSGAYFTGLSSQYTALRLRYKVFVEILTDPSDNTLAPLGTPTIPYRQDLQEVIMKTLSSLPAGVPQSWNPKGEAWRQALSILGSAVVAAAPVFSGFGPYGPPLAQLAGGAMIAGSQIKARPGGRSKKQGRKPKSTATTSNLPPLIDLTPLESKPKSNGKQSKGRKNRKGGPVSGSLI